MRIAQFAMILLLVLCGCSSGPQDIGYRGEYLESALRLEKALGENPDPANRKLIENRIKKLRELHEQMVDQQKN